MKYPVLLLHLLFASISFSQETDSTNFKVSGDENEDEILQKIESGTPSEPFIYFKETPINLFGKWCTVSLTADTWILSKTDDSSLISNCSGIRFHYYGKAWENSNGDYFQTLPTLRYEIKNTVLELSTFKNDSLLKTSQYVVTDFTGEQLTLKKFNPSQQVRREDLSSIFGETEIRQGWINDTYVAYSKDKCRLTGSDSTGHQRWVVDLNGYHCTLIYMGVTNLEIRKYDLAFQLADKRIFLLNSTTGKIKRAPEKRFL